MTEIFAIATLETAPAGRLGLCPLPGRHGDPAGDLETVSCWRPDLVVSLTEATEMAAGAPGAAFLAQGIAWAHWPVADFGSPDPAAEARWPALARRIHRILDEDGAVLVHCHGGRGRSGMVVLRLLIERGEPFATALGRLRSVRPGAVETPGQESWARRIDAIPITDRPG